jgi:TPR repeat protein
MFHPPRWCLALLAICLALAAGAQDFESTKRAAERGDAQAQYQLGQMYDEDTVDHRARSDAVAARWYRKAAQQGHGQAQYRLGYLHEAGKGVTQSDAEAVQWYRMAAEQGFAEAQYKLGDMYAHGRGVAKSYTEAMKLYRKLAEQGHAQAQSSLAYMYLRGEGVAQNTQSDAEAVKWFLKSVEQQGLLSLELRMLEVMHEHGRVTEKSDVEAVQRLIKAREQERERLNNEKGVMADWLPEMMRKPAP